MEDAHVRAGDADRERVAEALRRHFADGRLGPDEFEERLSAAYTARTMGDLYQLTADLPAEPRAYELPVPVSEPAPARRAPRRQVARQAQRAAFSAWLTASLVCWTIWLIVLIGTREPAGFWPIWVSGPWGAVLLAAWIAGKGNGPGRR